MQKTQLLEQLRQYQAKQKIYCNKTHQVMSFVKANDNCFQRENLEGHITGSAWLLNHTGDKALLTLHRKLGMWIQLGGHADGESNVLKVALQEAKEESGIEDIKVLSQDIFHIDVHLVPKFKEVPAHYHYDIRYLLQVKTNTPFVISDESIDLKWFSLDDFKSLGCNHSVESMVKKWQEWEMQTNQSVVTD